MIPEMNLEITENKQIIKALTKETKTHGSHFVQSLQEFQHLVNATITQIIEERGGNNQDGKDDSNDEGSEDEEDDALSVSPKKRKK